VIDHLIDANGSLSSVNTIVEILRVLKGVLAAGGEIHVRCHPWTSRHGTHAYINCNKAFIHYDTVQFDKEPTQRFLQPVTTYRDIFQHAGLTIARQDIIKQAVEDVFTLYPFTGWAQIYPEYSPYLQIMAINFVDYILV
jgi:hypothetical protein